MDDEVFLYGLLRDAAQSFAAKAKERQESQNPDPASQAKLMQCLGITAEETPNHEQPVEATSTPTVASPTKDHDAQVAKPTDSSLVKINCGSGNNQASKSVAFATFAYTEAVATFFMHHRAFRGTRPVLKNKTDDYERLAVSAIVFSPDADKVLLVQRAGTDLLGGKWETPGDLCENRDMTILHGMVRELYEGTGLAAKKVVATTGYNDLTIPSGPRCRKYAFMVELGAYRTVSLNPEKYLRCVWASERDVAMGWCEGHHLEFTGAEERLHIVRAFQEKEEADEGRKELGV
ncbi:hypothetical protein PG991_015016 [Apiospora marii]|uniref:Nudix hydrolase domain-containing protein n=1 Tax=Apiospora marii TaxID=335849 RepID=A0ABR1R2Y7_9PEZI